jgi:hypothetical protein
MQTIEHSELEQVVGGVDSLAKDIGQLLGGATGWIRANPATYFLLGPGVGGIAALIAGCGEALI